MGVQGYLQAGDERANLPAPVEKQVLDPLKSLLGLLEAQREAADRDGIDDDTYRRQREALYNGLLGNQFSQGGADHTDTKLEYVGQAKGVLPGAEKPSDTVASTQPTAQPTDEKSSDAVKGGSWTSWF